MKKTVLITGTSGGIGRATVDVFTRAGWSVIGVDKEKGAKLPGSAVFIQGDVSDPDSSADIFKKVAELSATLDALVNNAAVQICKPILEMDVGEWDSTMAVNVRSIFLMMLNASPFLRTPGASVVNISSVHAIATSINVAAYAASKGAVLSFTRALALETANKGIRVNAVIPGAIDTAMLHSGLGRGHIEGSIEEKLETLGNRTPLGRIGKPEEVAQAIFFLADNSRSSFISGHTLVVDGGATARLSTE